MKTAEQHEEMRNRLLDSTIKAVEKYGLSNLTTRAISAIDNINEAYIYRYFLDKDDMVFKAFARSEKIVFSKFGKSFRECIILKDKDFKDRLRIFFTSAINYLIDDRRNALMIIRYVYSIFFKDKSLESHKEITKPLQNILLSYMKDDSDVAFIGHNMVMTLLSYASEIINGSLPNNDETINKIFEYSYRCFEPDIDWEKVKKL